MALALTALPAAAQNQLWIHQLGEARWDTTLAGAPDGSGGVFASGNTLGSLGGPNAGYYDVWLARYDGAGHRLWIHQLGTSGLDLVFGAATDGSGGAYVCGYTAGSLGGPSAGASDAWLAHFDDVGDQLWMRQIGTGKSDHARASALDGSGGVYVVGDTHGSLGGPNAGSKDAWLARYDGAGGQLWIRQLGTSSGDVAQAAAPDRMQNGVYLAGYTGGSLAAPNAGSSDAFLARFDGAGNLLWTQQVGTSGLDEASAVAPDGADGVYVAGHTAGSLGGTSAGSIDAWLARYDGAGTLLWIRQLGTSTTDTARAAVPDGSGGLYVSGSTSGMLGAQSIGGKDAWLARFDSAGTLIWLSQFGSNAEDSVFAAAADEAGGAYLGGTTRGSLGGPNAGEYDAWVARFDGSCGTVSSYCTASTTSIPGCHAAIAGSGTPSLADPSGFTISSGSVPGGNVGLCLFGESGQASIPFGTLGGQICVQPPLFRSKPKSGGGTPGNCDGLFAFSLQDLIDTSPIVVAGAVLNAEIWTRDPANPDGFLLSDGLEFTVCQ